MGKGSNVQKAQAARERNQKKLGKSDEERKAAAAKAKLDAAAFMCAVCRQTFMVNAKPSVMYLHVTAKHPAEAANFKQFFPEALKDFDPEDPDGIKAAAEAKKADAARVARRKSSKKGGADELDLLSSGLKKTSKRASAKSSIKSAPVRSSVTSTTSETTDVRGSVTSTTSDVRSSMNSMTLEE